MQSSANLKPNLDDLLQKGIRAARRGHQEPARQLLSQVIQANPDSEEAWLWLARVIDQPEQRVQCLQQVLRLNPNNQWAAGQLAELPAAGSTPSLAADTVQPAAAPADTPQFQPPPASELSLEVLKCPHCSGELNVQSGAAVKTLVCTFCGSVLDLSGEQAAIIGQTNRKIKPAQPIQPGMEGNFEGERHQVIGWIRYEGWDDEDRWRWDEWLLLSAGGQFRWLSYDPEEGFILQQKIQPTAPFDPLHDSAIPTPDGQAIVSERAPARILALAGELTWQAKVGDRLTYVEAGLKDFRYSVEVTEQELELTKGRVLPELEVWRAFGREDLVQQAVTAGQWSGAYRVLALVCALLTFFGCAGVLFSGITGQQIFSQQVQLAQGEAGAQSVGPVEITQPGRPHQILLQAGALPTNSWAEVNVSIADETENELFLFAEEFWDEAGYDEGYWHENDLSGDYLFRPDEAGEYTLELSLEGDPLVSSLPVTVTVKQGVWLSRYFVIYTIISLVLALFFAVMSLGSKGTRALIKSNQ